MVRAIHLNRPSRDLWPDRRLRSIAATGGAHKVENAKQPRLIRPHANKVESAFGSQRGKIVWRIFVRILGDDFFAAPEMELVFVEMHELIDFTDEMHLNSAGVGIIDGAVPPLIEIEISAQLAVN